MFGTIPLADLVLGHCQLDSWKMLCNDISIKMQNSAVMEQHLRKKKSHENTNKINKQKHAINNSNYFVQALFCVY